MSPKFDPYFENDSSFLYLVEAGFVSRILSSQYIVEGFTAIFWDCPFELGLYCEIPI